MTDKEGASDWATIRVCVATTQHSQVMIIVVMIDGTVKRQQNHLRNLKHETE